VAQPGRRLERGRLGPRVNGFRCSQLSCSTAVCRKCFMAGRSLIRVKAAKTPLLLVPVYLNDSTGISHEVAG
jgi:hypothetical protein